VRSDIVKRRRRWKELPHRDRITREYDVSEFFARSNSFRLSSELARPRGQSSSLNRPMTVRPVKGSPREQFQRSPLKTVAALHRKKPTHILVRTFGSEKVKKEGKGILLPNSHTFPSSSTANRIDSLSFVLDRTTHPPVFRIDFSFSRVSIATQVHQKPRYRQQRRLQAPKRQTVHVYLYARGHCFPNRILRTTNHGVQPSNKF
jgi:hypothetical protein